MKVALVSSGSGSRGGGEIYLARLADGLSRQGHDVTALVPAAHRMDELAEALSHWAETRRFPFKACYERPFRCIGALLDNGQKASVAALFARLDADIIHINQQVAEDGLDLVMSAEMSKKPWVSTIHVGLSAKVLGARIGRLRDVVTHGALSRVSGQYIAVSDASRIQLQERLGPSSDVHLHVVRNGVRSASQSEYAEARRAARRAWMVDEDEIVVGTVGRIEAQKDPMALLDHVAAANQAVRRVRLVWIGDGSLRSELEARATLLGQDLAMVVDGWREDAALRVAGLDVFATPSRFEGLPFALLEAMMAGVPVVASKTDGIGEAVRHGETGLLCKSADDWARALCLVMSDSDLRRRMGVAARRVAQDEFSVSRMAEKTVEVYRKTVLGRSLVPAA